jgi:dihydrodipicolinate synthase/N-acetylneuraminate lyase
VARFPRCILATCVVPWDERGDFIEDLFRHQVRTLCATLTRHLYVFGTAGEGYAVSDRQFDRVVGVFHEEMRDNGAEAMVGVISLSLGTVLERIERAREVGVRLFQVSLPSWGPLNERELFDFFGRVCGAFPDCRFVHYNLARAKRLVTPAEYGRLAAAYPNLVGSKNCTDSITRVEELLTFAPQMRHFPGETGFAYGSLIGEPGLLISHAATNPRAAHAFFDAGLRRDMDTLLALQRELDAYGRDLVALADNGAHMDGTFDKMLWKVHDPRFPLRLLPPYQHASEEMFRRFRALLAERYPRWLPDSPG